MTDLNDVILIGRITKDVGSDERSFSFVGNGTAKAVVSLAVNRSVKKGDSWEDEVSYMEW
jgi:single-strand DNA-binding protein